MTAPLLSALVDLVLPRRCVGCSVRGVALCDECVAACGALSVVRRPPVDVAAAARYEGPLRQAVLAYKERGRRDLVRVLGVLLGAAVLRALGELDPRRAALVTVPSNAGAARSRGGDHVLRLARRAAVTSGVRVAPRVLSPARELRDSAGLGARERERNLHAALRARVPDRDAARRHLIVVDDIVTTGATLREAHRALTVAGWQVGGAAVIAATPRRVPAFHWQVPGERSSVSTT